MIELKRKTLGDFQTNCYLIVEQDTGEAILVDAPADAATILSWAAPHRIQLIVLTHGHPDHTGALDEMRQALDVPVAMHPVDARDFDLVADEEIEHGDNITFGENRLEVVHIPGHTQGSVALKVVDRERFEYALVGDSIFPGGPGNTTSPKALQQSLEALALSVFTWPDLVELHPGHGSPTTVGAERAAFEAFRKKPLPPDLYGDVLWR